MEPQLGDLGGGWELAELWVCVRESPPKTPEGEAARPAGPDVPPALAGTLPAPHSRGGPEWRPGGFLLLT